MLTLAVLPVAVLMRPVAVRSDRAGVGEWMTPVRLAAGAVEVAPAALALRMRRV